MGIIQTEGLAYRKRGIIMEYSVETTVIENGGETMLIDAITGTGEYRSEIKSFI